MAVSARRDSDEFTLSSDNLVALSPVKVGMLTFLGSEAAFFGTLIMTYVYFLRQTTHGEPNPSQVFRLPTVLAASACLFSSSATIYMAEKALRRNSRQTFLGWWGLTIVLGVLFLLGTMLEWNDLIGRWGLTISRNLFGTHVFHSGRFSRLARDHWRDRDEHCVRPGVAPANHGAERDRRGSRLLVLALCGWCLGGGLHFGVCRGTLSRNQETRSMTSSIDSSSDRQDPAGRESVEMPRATAWPIVLALGITLLGAGLATSLALSVVGAVLFVFGLGGWIGQLLPGRGHRHEPLVEPALRPRPVAEKPGTVDQLRPGLAGYRFRLPEKIHPISAGVKGGIVGGLVMPIPALAYGLISGHGLWFPVNLLAGMVVPGISGATEAQLEQFYWGALDPGDRHPRHLLRDVLGCCSGSSRRRCRQFQAAP